jgi:TPR repeat protein
MNTAHGLNVARALRIVAVACGMAAAHVALASDAAAPVPDANDCDRAAASDFDKQSPVAGVAFGKIDPKIAIPACLAAIAKYPDSPRLNFQLGRAYDADRNFSEALKFFSKAAAANFALAQVNLGSLYFNGQGVEKDAREAARWDRLAADQGLAPAEAVLGSLYVQGQGVERDYAQAQKWLRLAAEQGFAPAEFGLGNLLANGQGVSRDEDAAMRLYGLAADHGFAAARASLEALQAARAAQAAASAAASEESASRPAPRFDPAIPRYWQAPIGEGYSPVRISVKAPDARVSNRVAATMIEISPISPDFSMAGFAVNKGQCRVYIDDPTALLRASALSAEATPDAAGAKGGSTPQAEMEKISLVPPPFNPPISAKLGQYMTFYVDPSVCAVEEVEVLVNGREWRWTPG